MSIQFVRHIGLLLLMTLLHLLVLMHVHLWGVATPLLYICVVSTLRRGYPKWGILLWGFVTGILIDTVQNTPGMAAAAMTFAAALQPYLLDMFLPREAEQNMSPTVRNMGWGKWIAYVLLLTLSYSIVFFTLQFFSFFDLPRMLLCVISSTLLTLLTLMAVEAGKKPVY